jgi:PAS domain S-box-containing protein
MINKDDMSFQASEFRRQAEEIALEKPALSLEDIHAMSGEDIQQIFHELRVHQIELEMQKEELCRAHAQIKAGRDRYFDLYNQAPVGYCTLSEHGLILEANLTAVTLLGLPRSELVTQPFSRFIHSDDQHIYSLHRKQLLETATLQKYDLRLVKPGGDYIWVHLKETVVQGDDGAPLCRVVLSDISGRIRAEKQRKIVADKYAAVVATTSDAVLAVNMDSRITVFNPGAEKLFGCTADEVLGLPVTRFCPKDLMEEQAEIMRRVLDTGTVAGYESERLTADGRRIPVEITLSRNTDDLGRPLGMSGILRNISERKQAEEILIESEALFRGMFTDHSAVMLLIDPNTGQIAKANQAAAQYYGYPLENLIRMKIQQLNVLTPVEIAEKMAVAFNKQVNIFEFQHVLAGGQVRDVEVHSTPIKINNQIKLFSIISDITDRKRTEEALKKSERFLNATVDGLAAHITVLDDRGEIILTNKAYRDFAAQNDIDPLTVSEGANYLAVCDTASAEHSEEATPVAEGIRDVLSGKRRFFKLEYPCHSPSEERWFIVHVTPFDGEGSSKVVVAHENITERKRAEDTLIRQQRSIKLNNRISNVFLTSSQNEVYAEVLHVILTALDSRFGYFGYIDEAGDLVCPSLTRDVWDQCQVSEKSIVFSRACWGGLWGRSLLEKQTLIVNENLRIPEGHVALENALASPIVYNNNLIGQFVVANKAGGYDKDDQDLLENVAVQTAPILFAIQEEARRKIMHEKIEAQLHQAQKMESIGRLAGGVAHDFNNMLGAILGYTELALEQVKPDAPLHADLKQVYKAAQRSAELTRQLLTFARKQTVTPQVLDLNETVEGMLKLLRRLIGEDIDLAWLPGRNLWPVKIDQSQHDQILANLCVNARDAITGMGKITIETSNMVFDSDFSRQVDFVPGDYVLLAISDNGCGMDTETLSHIFEPFFTTKEVGEGTGLGLPSVYGAVKQNNGFIYVYSEPGRGTTFKIYLPRHRDKATEKEIHSPPLRAAQGSEIILLVEDEPMILELTTTMLQRFGYTVLAAGTPSEAVKLAQEHPDSINLLLTDVIMPEMNGHDLAQNLLSLYPGMKLVFMSGYTANVIAHHGVLDEGVHFIQKPFSAKNLALKLREALEC